MNAAMLQLADGVRGRSVCYERAAGCAPLRLGDDLRHGRAHDCGYVSITTTLGGEPMHRQTVACEAVRAFVRGVFTEEEFWLLVEHESLA